MLERGLSKLVQPLLPLLLKILQLVVATMGASASKVICLGRSAVLQARLVHC